MFKRGADAASEDGVTIFNLSGETNERDRLLSLLMEWTTEERIIAAMVIRNRADFPGIASLAAMVRATLDASAIANEAPKDGEARPLSERQIVAAILAFVSDGETRNIVARYTAQAHAGDIDALPGESKYDAAKRELYDLRVHLQTTHKINAKEIPELFAGDPEAQEAILKTALAERGLTNAALAWAPGDPKPAWVEEYERDDYPMSDEAVQFLRSLIPEVRDVAIRFPPLSLVRGVRELVCPAPGLVAIVRGYEIEAGEVVVLVSAYLDENAPRVGARPAWLERVACRGGITEEAVTSALAGSFAISGGVS